MTWPLAVKGEIIERVKNRKYLVVIIDEKLTFNEHNDLVAKTAVFLIKRLTHQLTSKSKRRI